MSKVKINKRQLTYRITQVGERAAKGISTVMRDEAEQMAELARSYAPVDEGHLEEAIDVKHDYEGLNGRLRVSVFVRMSTVVRGDGKRIEDYAKLMHEGLAPYGSGAFELGPKSRAKAAAGNRVGGKFLERAIFYRSQNLIERAEEIVRKQLR